MTLASQYARAIYDVRNNGTATDSNLSAEVLEALKRRHHEKLLPNILEEYRKIEQQEEKSALTIRLASEKEKHPALSVLKTISPKHGEPKFVVDASLGKGFVIEGKDFRYDASAKRFLVELYKKLITT